MSRFIGRKAELQHLVDLSKKKTASFVVVRGRRRIGKSRMIEEYGKNFDHFYTFMGLAPDKNVTAKHQLDEFSRQMSQQFSAPYAKYEDWSDVLWALGDRVQQGKILLFFDEISWMGSEDPTFLAKIKNFWDQHLKKNDNLVFVVCGSASSWIEKNIMSSKGFVGRISSTITLEELTLPDCSLFWPPSISAFEKLKVLAVTGGIPKYLEEIDPHLSAEENIKRLCFHKGGMLVDEFNHIFSDLFLRDSVFYKKIVQSLIEGPKEREEMAKILGIDANGRFTEYLTELDLSGFITQDHTWNLATGIDSKLRKYRLKDNYMRFYLNYIDKNMSKIQRDRFQSSSLTSLPGWEPIIALQFENLILNNRHLIHDALHLSPHDIICENPFYQRPTKRWSGCQIDYMIQTKFSTLYICEIKFSKNPIGPGVISDVQQKIDALSKPKSMSCRPVLIHVNGVKDAVTDADYFASTIDASDFFQKNHSFSHHRSTS